MGDAHGRGHVDVDERIVGDHALVHAIEREAAPVGAPEGAFVNAEFVTVNGGAVEPSVETEWRRPSAVVT